MDLSSYNETFGKNVSDSMYDCSIDKHIPDCARVLPSNYKTSSEHAHNYTRALPSNEETFSEHVHDCRSTRVLPSNEETFSEHESDSMDGCVVDKLLPSNFIIRQITWLKNKSLEKEFRSMYWTFSKKQPLPRIQNEATL